MIEERSAAEIVHEANEEKRLELVNTKKAVPILWEAGKPLEFVPLGKIADRCLAHIAASDSPTGLEWWIQTNREGLRQFWALAPHEALEVKKAWEGKLTPKQETKDLEATKQERELNHV